LGSSSSAQDAKVPDFNKPSGQKMEQKTPEEFRQAQGHFFVDSLSGVIFIVETHVSQPEVQPTQTRGSNRHAMGVAGEIAQDSFWSGKRAFGIHNPGGAGQLMKELRPGSRFSQRRKLAVALPILRVVFQSLQKFCAKHFGQGAHRKKEVG